MARTMLGCCRPWTAYPSRWRLRRYCGSVGILAATSWSVHTWWWARQTSPNVPAAIRSCRTYSPTRWLGLGMGHSQCRMQNDECRIRTGYGRSRLRASVTSILHSAFMILHSLRYFLRDPVARQQIIDSGHQRRAGEKDPAERAVDRPPVHPRQDDGLQGRVRHNQRHAGEVGLELPDPPDEHERCPRDDADQEQPAEEDADGLEDGPGVGQQAVP